MPALPDKLISAIRSAPSPQRPFAEQRGGQRKRNLQCFGAILNALSGGDKASLLRDFFSSRDGRPLLEQLDFEPKDTSQQLMEGLQSLHASASSHEVKRALLSVVSRVSSRSKLWKKGFRFSPATLTRARKSTLTGVRKRAQKSKLTGAQKCALKSTLAGARKSTRTEKSNGSTSQSAEPSAPSAAPCGPCAASNAQPGRPSISKKETLLLWLERHSRPAANRTMWIKRMRSDRGADVS